MAGPTSLGGLERAKPDERLLYVIGTVVTLCAAVYLPLVMGVRGFLGAVLLLFTGILLGIAAVLGGVVLVFILVTKEAPPSAGPAAESQELDLPGAEVDRQLLSPEQRQQEHDSIVQEMLQGAGVSKPPHPYVSNGRFSGWVWTIPSSKYDNSEALANWPPATVGAGAVATKWWASQRGSTLYLARSSGLEKSYLVPVVEVDLKGCQVEVVKDGLKTKSRWWRKCPLQISNADRWLLHDESSFAFFAEGSAAKEQWYAALREAAGSAPSRQAVEQLYSRFCEQARAGGAPSRYPLVKQEEEGESAGKTPSGLSPASSLKAPAASGKGWGSLFSRRRSQKQQQRAGSPLKRRSSNRSDTSTRAGFVNPLEFDKAWMGKGALPKHLAAPAVEPVQQDVAGSSEDGSKVASQDDSHAPELGEPAGASSEPLEGVELRDLRSGESNPEQHAAEASLSTGEDLPGSSPKDSKDPEGHPAEDSSSRSPERSPAATAFAAEFEGSDGLPAGGLEVPEGGESPSDRQRPPPQAALIEQAVNMALARLAFDLLRSPAVKSQLQARIHRKLNELRMPAYIHGFEVVDLKMGSTPPAIHNLKAMASQNATLWPQFTFDLDYQGDISLVIEAKVDLRDGVAWSQFDRAINRLEGGPANGGSPEALTPDESEDDADAAVAETSEDVGKGSPRRKGFLVTALRQRMAKGIRQLAEVTADHLSRMQLRLQLDIKALKGPMCVWMPPPPGDRLWFSFVKPPQLETIATPLVGGRLLKYSYQASRASKWVAGKLQSSITKNLVYPSCSDIVLPFLLGLDHPDYSYAPPHFLAKEKEEQGGKGSKRRSAKTKTVQAAAPLQSDQPDVEAKLGAALHEAEAAAAELEKLEAAPSDRGMIVSPAKKEVAKEVHFEESSPEKKTHAEKLSSPPPDVPKAKTPSEERKPKPATTEPATAEPSSSRSAAPPAETSRIEGAAAAGGSVEASTPIPEATTIEPADEAPIAAPSGDLVENQQGEPQPALAAQAQTAALGGQSASFESTSDTSPHSYLQTQSLAASPAHSAPVPVEEPNGSQQLQQSYSVPQTAFVTRVSSSRSHHESSVTTSQVLEQHWTPAEVFFQDGPQTPNGRGEAAAAGSQAGIAMPDFPSAGSSPEAFGEELLGRQGSGSQSARDPRLANSWQQRLNATGSVMQKNWEAFKTRNPNTMEQGKKLAGAMDRLREQAQEQLKRTQEQIRKNQELRKTQRTPTGQKTAQKEA